MPNLTDLQKTVLAGDIAANTAVMPAERPFAGLQVKDIPHNPDGADAVAWWYSQPATPTYLVHRESVTRGDVYKTRVLAANSSTAADTVWSWAGYKAQSVPEQGAWLEMMMGGCDFGSLENRDGVREIFGTAGNGGANRLHIFNVGRRSVNRVEKLFVVAVVAPPVNTGNTAGQPRGGLANPDTLGYVGGVSLDDIKTIWGI